MIRSGIGFDAHQLKKGIDLYIGGIKIDSDLGSLGHSDGDALIHALVDSLLGAAGMGDIGEYFAREKKEGENAKSEIFFFQHEEATFKSTMVFTKNPIVTLIATPIIPKKLHSIINDINEEERYAIYPKNIR